MNYREAIQLRHHDPVRIKSTGDTAEILAIYADGEAQKVIVYVEREDIFGKHTEIRDIGDLE
jgi:hypothetical protein